MSGEQHPTQGLRDKLRGRLAQIVAMERQTQAHGERIHAAGRARVDAQTRDIAALQRQMHHEAEHDDLHPADLDVLEPMLHQRRRLETVFPADRKLRE